MYKVLILRQRSPGKTAAGRDLPGKGDESAGHFIVMTILFKCHGIVSGIECDYKMLFLICHLRSYDKGSLILGFNNIVHIGNYPHLKFFL